MGVTEVMTTVIDGASTESRDSGKNYYRDINIVLQHSCTGPASLYSVLLTSVLYDSFIPNVS